MDSVYEQTWDVLEALLKDLDYIRDRPPEGRPRFQLVRDDENNYAVLYIFTWNPDSYAPERMRYTRHEFVVPVATYHREGWRRWVFDNIMGIEDHETCESFLDNGVRVYAPHHGNGWDPYTLWYDGHPEEQKKAPGDD